MRPTEELGKQLGAGVKSRIKGDDSAVPSPDGPFAYYQRFETGGQHPVFCRCPVGDREAGEEVLLDGNREAAGESYFRVAACEHSPDPRLLAYAIDRNGSERYRIEIGRAYWREGGCPDVEISVVDCSLKKKTKEQ